jgi:hypothetical protein
VSGGAVVLTLLLAQGDAGGYAQQPFRAFWQPLPVWDYWYILLVPLCLGISIVYKSIKCRTMRQVPREAAVIFLMIMMGMILAAAALVLLVRGMERR